MISTSLGDPRPERGGKDRRVVRVERTGREAAREMRRAFERMWVGLGRRVVT